MSTHIFPFKIYGFLRVHLIYMYIFPSSGQSLSYVVFRYSVTTSVMKSFSSLLLYCFCQTCNMQDLWPFPNFWQTWIYHFPKWGSSKEYALHEMEVLISGSSLLPPRNSLKIKTIGEQWHNQLNFLYHIPILL